MAMRRRHRRTKSAQNSGAIVLGGNVNGLGVVRSLGRLGVPCALVYATAPDDHAHNSRYVSLAAEVSDQIEDHALLLLLKSIRLQMSLDAICLIPTSDRFSQFLSANIVTLEQDFILNCSDDRLCNTFLDKWLTAEICRHHSVLSPRTICPTSSEELKLQASELTFPVIVKPRYTFDSRFPGKNAHIIDYDELLDFYQENNLLGAAVIQEIIPSGDGDILVLASYSDAQGKVVSMYSGRKLRQYLPDYGATCLGISEKQPNLERETTEFLDAIGYRGFAMVEYARSRHDGRFYFLELNTRTSWTNQLFVDSGIDLTQIGFLEMTGNDYSIQIGSATQKDGVIFLDFRRDFASMRIKRQQGKIRLVEWLLSILSARSFAFWDTSDPAPFFAACVFRLKSIITRCRLFFR